MLAEIMKDSLKHEKVQYFFEYRDKKYLFAFLDILGYSSKIRVKAAEDYLGSFIADVMALEESCVPEALEVVRHKTGLVSQVKTMIFSDSFCLYWEIGDYDDIERNITEEQFQVLFEDVIDFICDIQNRALIHNIFFRGAFAIGRHYQYGNVTVSEALVKAHDVEGRSIKYPRVGFDITQGNEYLENQDFIQKLIAEGRMKQEDNIVYIDYLQMFRRVKTWHPLNKSVERMTIENNRKCYFDNINLIDADESIDEAKKPGILNKYRWLRDYHNEKCEELGYPDLTIE